jgi:membrane fusion protein, multidrug efflux system
MEFVMNNLLFRDLSNSAFTLFTVGALLLNSGCGGKGDTRTHAAALPPATVVVANVAQKTVPIYSEFVGQTKAHETVELRARVEGILQKIYFTEGAPVRKGELLMTIDKKPFQATVQSAQALVAKAQSDLAQARQRTDVIKAQAELADAQATKSKTEQDLRRMKPLAQEKAVTELELDAAIAAEKSAQANVDAKKAELINLEGSVKYTIERAAAEVSAAQARLIQTQLDLSYCDVYSPMNGIIGFKNVDEGNLVGRGEATLLATVSSADPLLVDFSLSEVDYLTLTDPSRGGRPKGGRTIEMILSNDTVHPYPGTLKVVDRKVDPATGTLKVQVSFPNPGSYLRPGQFARIRAIVASRENVLVVPQRAIQELQGAKTVMVVDPQNKVSVRTVTVGEKSGDEIIVINGVEPGERVIVEGMQKVRPGSEVVPTAGESKEVNTEGN